MTKQTTIRKARKQIETFEGRRGFYWRARDKNGKIVADGAEAYSTRSNARRAARRIGFGLLTAPVVDLERASSALS
jgi:uncharacterized protein YegP (UPF0339 family)